ALPLPINADPREQQMGEHEHSYKQGYQGQQQSAAHHHARLYQGPMDMSERTRRPLWPWLVVIATLICLIPLLLGAMAMMAGPQHEFVQETHAPAQKHHESVQGNHAFNGSYAGSQLDMHAYTYDMAHISTVKIDDPTGSIHVHGSMPGTQGRIEALSDSSAVDPLQFVQNGDGTLSIQVNPPADGNPVLLNLALPQNIALHLHTSSGHIEVDGIHGQVNLQADSSIILANDSISGQSNISSLQGGVQIANSSLSGIYRITSNSGSIALPRVDLSGRGQFQAQEEGNIIMSGTLNSQGNYTFTSASGEIALALPGDTAMQLHIDQGTGNLSSDFPMHTSNGAHVMVKTKSGDILVRQEP
ncbi:MAG: DUF4097 family beta strand repeat-containing protein, partial [Ktedonobacteraceae bacterium]